LLLDVGALNGSPFQKHLELALADKREVLASVVQAYDDNCTELLDLRGPIEVNGVAQGHSLLRFAVSCKEPIKEVDLGLDGEKWTQVETSSGTAKVGAGGDMLEIDLNDVKYVSGTAEGKPDFQSGDKVEGEIVPVAGDSAPPVDETM
jgi:hypothetical protein